MSHKKSKYIKFGHYQKVQKGTTFAKRMLDIDMPFDQMFHMS